MDDPALLEPEWKRKKVVPALRDLYDEIWVYGLPQICDPLAGIAVTRAVKRKISYTGYLRRTAGASASDPAMNADEPYLLITTGGGGDGEALIDWVLRAYEMAERTLPHPALFVLGPFMQTERQNEFLQRARQLKRVRAITFDANLEALVQGAAGVVAMGGYNTFCEILSFDKRALIVPRTAPRLEQFIRAERASELGLVRMLPDDGTRDARAMVTALRALAAQKAPSSVVVPGLLDGLDNVNRLMSRLLQARERAPHLAVVSGD
jgi:predicted glycosyltransferase